MFSPNLIFGIDAYLTKYEKFVAIKKLVLFMRPMLVTIVTMEQVLQYCMKWLAQPRELFGSRDQFDDKLSKRI